jgi:hypothetical protein
VTVTTTVSGAVALLLYGARADRDVGDALLEAIIELRDLVGADTRAVVDRWIAEGGPDGEQIYCLDHLLRERFSTESSFRAAVEQVVGTGPVTRDAVTALAEHCRREGFHGAYAWCQTALAVPAVVTQVPPAPVNRTVTAPR